MKNVISTKLALGFVFGALSLASVSTLAAPQCTIPATAKRLATAADQKRIQLKKRDVVSFINWGDHKVINGSKTALSATKNRAEWLGCEIKSGTVEVAVAIKNGTVTVVDAIADGVEFAADGVATAAVATYDYALKPAAVATFEAAKYVTSAGKIVIVDGIYKVTLRPVGSCFNAIAKEDVAACGRAYANSIEKGGHEFVADSSKSTFVADDKTIYRVVLTPVGHAGKKTGKAIKGYVVGESAFMGQ